MVTATMRRRRGSTNTGTTATSKIQKTRVFLEHACYICGNIFSSAKATINHCQNIHGYSLPTRSVGQNRPQDDEFEYVRDRNEEVDELHYACPSCWFHCPELEDTNEDLIILNNHVREEHEPENTDKKKGTSDEPLSRRGSTGGRSSSNTPRSARSRSNSASNKAESSTSAGNRSINNRRKSNMEDEEEQGNSGSNTPKSRRSSVSAEDIKSLSVKLEELTKLFKSFFSDDEK